MLGKARPKTSAPSRAGFRSGRFGRSPPVCQHGPSWHSVLARGLAALVAVGLLAGCGSSSSDDAADDQKLLATVSTATTVDPWAVPSTIDDAYAQRVIQQLSNVLGDVRQDVFDNHVYTDEDKAKIAATHAGLLLTNRDADMATASTSLHPLIRNSPSPWNIHVEQVSGFTSTCMYVFGKTDDSSNRLDDGYVPDPSAWGLKYDASSKSGINPTGWKFIEDVPRDHTGGNPCAG